MSALDLIGNTPVMPLQRITGGGARLLAKAEFMQPGGSIKDRAAKAIILAARADGRLAPGRPVIEMSSGNMGAGLAVACAVLGHPLVVTMSAGNSAERAQMMQALGAEVVLVPQVDGAAGQVTGPDIAAAADTAKRLARERDGFYVDQFNAAEGVRVHEQETAAEIWRQTDGGVDAWVACVGTGATFVGVARALKRLNPAVLCVAVEPEGSQPLAGKPVQKPRHLLQGTGYGAVPPHWDSSLVDLCIAVSDDDAREFRQRLAREEGLHVGFSSAANVAAALRLQELAELPDEPCIVTVLCDSGLKYPPR
jgi:cysteine synthase A